MTTPSEELTSNSQIASNGYKVRLDVFEGPLDLLLYLIKKEEIDIYDIPIARITTQYLEYLRLMRELDIDVAGEFLVMAATLIHIKSKLLLPNEPEQQSELEAWQDPRQELVHRLLEHKKFKSAAEMLWSRAEVEQAVFTRAVLDSDLENPEVAATVFDLVEIFKKILERRRDQIEVEIAHDQITMAQKVAEIREIFKDQIEISVTDLFAATNSRHELVITFLAILELVKEYVIKLIQEQPFSEIRAVRR
ncbi:MAG: segregation/condensation protein A [Acidobacteriota bacterium]